MTEQNNTQMESQPTQPQSAPQPIVINNVMGQSDDSGKKKAPGFLKVLIYSVLTGGIYFFYWLVKMLSGGYRKR
ncbi:MAG: hypothetical protein [Bacteriophage sp.]|nr:MAG: hypothetical protein [Bacteriophage sp.]